MNKKSLLLGFTLASVVSLIASAAGQQFTFAGDASGTNTNHAFGFVATKLIVANDGAASIWADFADCVAVATSAGGAEVKAGEKLTVSIDRNEPGWNCVGVITAGGSVSHRVIAIRNNP